MNSGLDTEAIVEAMTAATKLKITKQNRKAITLKWKQEAYQDVTTKLTDFQKKFFDMLDSKTNLKSASSFNKYKATVSQNVNGVLTEGSPAGVTVKSQSGAVPGTYNVKVNKTATQAKYQGSAMDTSSLDFSNYSDSTQTYTFSLKVGDKATNVSFTGGSADDIKAQINSQLTAAYGESNTTATTGRGLVYINDSGKLVSSDRTSMTMSGVMSMEGDISLNMNNLKQGTNKLNLTIGSNSYSVSFQTFDAEYFGNEDGTLGAITREEYQNIHFNLEGEKAYNAAKEAGEIDSDALKAEAYEKAKSDAYQAEYDKELVIKKSAYEEQLKKDFEAGKADGSIADGIEFEDWKATQPEYDEEAFKVEFDEKYNEDFNEEAFKAEFDKNYDELAAYKELKLNKDDYALSNEDLATWANRHELEKALSSVKLPGDATLSLSDDGTITASDGSKIAVAADPSSANTYGVSTATSSASQVTTGTTLKELGIEGDATIKVNGVSFTFSSDYTIKKMMNEINASKAAGATMSFSTLTNSFSISSSKYGTEATLDFTADAGSDGDALLSTLGLKSGTFTAGTNLEIEVNGEVIETSSNSYTADGTTMTFTSAAAGSEFTYEVKKDNSEAIDAIKEFVKDYNQLLEDVFKYVDEKPNSDYYALTDDDIEEMDLSEKQQEKWETMAKKGLLYNDSAVSSVMQKMRSVLYSTVKTADGQNFSLFSMGITTSDDWTKHGQLELDEKKLEEAFENFAPQIEELFTGTTIDEEGNTVKTGIMHKLDEVLTSAVKTTGARNEKGSLVQIAGMKTGTAATDNSIFDQLKSIQNLIDSLEERYENQQDRYWKQFSSLESIMGNLNSQTTYIQQLMQF
ncbi:MAG: flagellar capping protein [Ruminococcaceae bacterium]|nr:flagellar capping protein [Oscillospiraceae bacterium]